MSLTEEERERILGEPNKDDLIRRAAELLRQATNGKSWADHVLWNEHRDRWLSDIGLEK